jgi:hypothetical protein
MAERSTTLKGRVGVRPPHDRQMVGGMCRSPAR